MKSKWNDIEASKFVKKFKLKGINEELALRIYSSRLLGNDPNLVLHGGGNTSLKTKQRNSFGKVENIIFVKGSGKDMSDIDIDGFPILELDNLQKLKKLRSINDFKMINFQKKYMIDTSFPNASVETLLHAFLPHKYIDHTHSNSILSLIDQPNDKSICKRIFNNKLGIVPYIMPGFQLSKKAYEIFNINKDIEGLILLKHGIFTFGNTAKQSYQRMIKYVNLAEKELNKKIKIKKVILTDSKINPSILSNYFRKHLSTYSKKDFKKKIIKFSKFELTDEFFKKSINSTLKGPVTPDHVIRIKHKPLLINLDNIKYANIDKYILKKINQFKHNYIKYFNRNKYLNKNSKIHDPYPFLILVKRIGLFSVGNSFMNAKICEDVGKASLSTIYNANKYGKFKSISEKDIFKMEYWPLELAKIKKQNQPLLGNVTLISGGLGTIGFATALKFKNEGSEVILLDKKNLNNTKLNGMTYLKCDVTNELEVIRTLNYISKLYGGLDIVISNAGFAIQKSLLELNKIILDKSFNTNFFAHHYLAKHSVEILKRQSTGGSILFNISKQAINPGVNFGSYGLPKATLMFLMKQYALEYGKYNIRFNGVNADRVKSGILTKEMIKKRAKIRGLSIKNYMSGNLLNKEVLPEDVATSFFHLAISLKTTACILTVDGGNIEASLR